MNRFVSTRGGETASFAQALLRGLAPDGGLYVPEDIPTLGEHGPGQESPSSLTFADSARWTAHRWLDDAMEPALLDAVVSAAHDFPVPLVEVEDGTFVLELFHGPSLAFKDVGARFMARAMAALSGPDADPATVLVATSGDTGGAVAAAFHQVQPFQVVVLFPRDGISERQRRQMTTLGDNVWALAVDGTFDDCQRMAKQAFADDALRQARGLTSANSINIGRLLPQAFYYVHAAATLGWSGPPATFVVPSGNLGNLCAGLLAHRAGMPAAGFVAGLNPNRAFADYLETGQSRPVPSVPSYSNAMDVGDPSNLERIRWLFGDDADAVNAAVRAVSVSDPDTAECIRAVHRRAGYLLDPHTAVGWLAMERSTDPGAGPRVVLSTAHPAKFPDVVEKATGEPVPVPEALAARLSGEERMIQVAATHQALRSFLLSESAR